MNSHLLVEGILDVKDPRGSEDRKFWKAWRRLWISFSVIYPSGRAEPYLILNLSNISNAAPEKEIKVPRDGLRLFRCRSKSRPYRTWAIASGNRVVLYFAAESEIQGQNWMQVVREGLWPPCFSFQMLTACSHEVSLIDDDNTFLSGLLGVYGRFVLTSEDVISLMHPHWGATLLQISLNNVKDVLFVREAEVSPAGVLSILLKSTEGSKVKALQFFCNTAKETIQWILNKLYTKYITDDKEPSENEALISILNESVLPNSNIQVIGENVNLGFSNPNHSMSIKNKDDVQNSPTNPATDYENLHYLIMNPVLNINKLSGNDSINGLNSVEYGTIKQSTSEVASEDILLQQSRVYDSATDIKNTNEHEGLGNILPNFKTNDNIYVNIEHGTDSTAEKSFSFPNENSVNEYENIKLISENIVKREVTPPVSLNNVSDSAIYSVVSKSSASKVPHHQTLELQFSKNQLSTNKEYINKTESISRTNKLNDIVISTNPSQTNLKNKEINYTYSSNKTANTFPVDKQIDYTITEASNTDSVAKDNTSFHHALNTETAGNKSISKDSSERIPKVQLSMNGPLNDYIKINNSRLLPNLPSDFLDTSIHFINPKDKMMKRSSLSEDDTEILPWIADESSGLNCNEQVYEDILDRRGTVYEEIDASDDDDDCTANLPPELPNRPEKLEIPDSLRLQKLSKSINQTLKVMENTHSTTKEYSRPNFIKKIKDVSRIMQISLNQEYGIEPFMVEAKLPVKSKNRLVLRPNILNSPADVNRMDSVQTKPLNADFS